MGNLCSNSDSKSPPASSVGRKPSSSGPAKLGGGGGGGGEGEEKKEVKKLDPKDFILSKATGTTLIRKSGQIEGQQFCVEECEDCDIYLMDYNAAITIDECKRCRFFIGPCESSVFIRTSSDCQVIVAAQQIRLRDCKNLDLMVYVSAGQPVIENSKNIRFSAFQFNYFSLRSQFKAAHLNPWNSEWSNIYDFHGTQGRHWDYLPFNLGPFGTGGEGEGGASSSSSFLHLIDGIDYLPDSFVVPCTYGSRPLSPRQSAFVALWWGYHDEIGYSLLEKLKEEMKISSDGHLPDLLLIRSRAQKLSKEKLATVFKKNKQAMEGGGLGEMVGLEFDGEDAYGKVKNALEAIGALGGKKAWIPDNPADVQHIINTFFEPIKVF